MPHLNAATCSTFGSGLLILILLCGNNAAANDIAREVRVGSQGPDLSNGGFLELGLGLELSNNLRVQEDPDKTDNFQLEGAPSISGAFRYRGFFAGFTEGSFDGINIGYNFYSSDFWSYDLLLSSFQGELNIDVDEIEDSDSEAARNRKLLNRDTFYNGAGFRATRYYNDYILQLRLVSDIHHGNGYQATGRVGRHLQLGNWNLHAVGGLVYDSSKLSQYLWGVTAEEATERFPEYTLGGGFRFQLEGGGLYPLTKDWVFRSILRYTWYPEDVFQSPLIDDHFSLSLGGSLNYVF